MSHIIHSINRSPESHDRCCIAIDAQILCDLVVSSLYSKKITKDFSQLNKYEVTEKGSKVAVIGLGTFYNMGCEVAKAVEEKTGTKATVINPYYITGIDEVLLEDLKKDHDVVITLEDGFLEGGFGEKIARFYGDSDVKVLNYGVKKELLDRYDIEELLKKNHLTVQQIVGDLKF